MKIALIGYGKMGHAIERVATQRGHEIVERIDVNNTDAFNDAAFKSADVAIEFTTPQTAVNNIRRAWQIGKPVVSGTTGWNAQFPELQRELRQNGHTLFWSSNFSIGVNLFMAINRRMAELMNAMPQYDVQIQEIHHIHKKDAPSGTAITLAEDIIQRLDRKTAWVLSNNVKADQISIEALREGEIPGTHTVTYTSSTDSITMTHAAKNRDGFALGAVLAAEFILGKQGFFGMNDMLHIN